MKLLPNDVIIDVETSCDLDISQVGTYKYCTHSSLRLLLVSFTVGTSDDVFTYDLTVEALPQQFIDVLNDPHYRKHAHNAVFEILVFQTTLGITIDVRQWYCSMVAVAFCGLPLGLEDSAIALNSKYKKLKQGTSLIKFFSCPTKEGGYNDPRMYPQKWEEYVIYNKYDVLTEKSNLEALPEIPEVFEEGSERSLWLLDFEINNVGIPVNVKLARNATAFCDKEDVDIYESAKGLGINNPNSRKQVIEFLQSRGIAITSLKADDYDTILTASEGDEIATAVIQAKQTLSLTSASKFQKFSDMEINGRIYGALQFYAAVRTGRWAGRGIQPQNMKRNEMPFESLELLRKFVLNGMYRETKMFFGDVKRNITELTRTIIEPKPDHVFLTTDFSAIEARVTAWIAEEQWRIDVFNTHGKIYEASASQMFKVPMESITKGSMERMKGKYAELALGFGGWVDAFKRFGAEKFMSENEMRETAVKWREASPNVVKMWSDTYECALCAIRDNVAYTTKYGAKYELLTTDEGRKWLTCKLPSGRRLFYYEPELCASRGKLAFKYRRSANEQDTWYGIMVENVVQALARDLLAYKMLQLRIRNIIVPTFHVHDEIIIEVHKDDAQKYKKILDDIMSEEVPWAKGLPLKGDTSILPFYMKE